MFLYIHNEGRLSIGSHLPRVYELFFCGLWRLPGGHLAVAPRATSGGYSWIARW